MAVSGRYWRHSRRRKRELANCREGVSREKRTYYLRLLPDPSQVMDRTFAYLRRLPGPERSRIPSDREAGQQNYLPYGESRHRCANLPIAIAHTHSRGRRHRGFAMTFETHPRQIARFRDARPACAATPSFKCRECKTVRYQFAGRRKAAGGGWVCVECNSIRADHGKENAS